MNQASFAELNAATACCKLKEDSAGHANRGSESSGEILCTSGKVKCCQGLANRNTTLFSAGICNGCS